MSINEYFESNNWEIVYQNLIPNKNGIFESYDDLNLSKYSLNYLSSIGNNIYLHQKEGIIKYKNGLNVCLSTPTASGKSLVFQVCAIELLNKTPESKILAIYPLKALCSEQEDRFKRMCNTSQMNISVGRIDGGVSMSLRKDILAQNQIIIMTPDVVHAWLLNNISSRGIQKFLSNLKLIVIDEAHIYSGVFGSNSAFLFRRMNHLIKKLNGEINYIAASATIEKPEKHLEMLTGLEFDIVDSRFDGSPQNEKNILMVNPPETTDLLTSITDFIKYLASETNDQFITFVDSRKQTEYIASISKRTSDVDEDSLDLNKSYDALETLDIYPYRSGYEESDRIEIQNHLETGDLKGVISTSALEMGIDIPYLTLGILVGVPRSSTSFYQRIGRVGRSKAGTIIIINNNTVFTRNIFRNPEELLNMPYSQSALYLENQRIQYIHALCLARQGGENDIVNSHNDQSHDEFTTEIKFPNNFVSLCNNERIGEISPELQYMKGQAGEDPHHTYPLRDIDEQYHVEYNRGPERRRLGTLSFSQLMREAYPGAVYYYHTNSYRVYKINRRSKLVEVRHEKKYTTKPTFLPTLIFPNLTEGNIYQTAKYDDLKIIECSLQISESIIGFKERRGPTEIVVNYPLDTQLGLYYNNTKFTRNYFTTGVIFDLPDLNEKNVNVTLLAEIIFEAFLITIPFDRQDVGFGNDKHRKDRPFINKDTKFFSIFDQTYGSLRLTSNLLNQSNLTKILEKTLALAMDEEHFQANNETINVIKKIIFCLEKNPETIKNIDSVYNDIESTELIIMPKSKGLFLNNSNEEFVISDVFYNPQQRKLMYKGNMVSEIENQASDSTLIHIIPIGEILEIPGVSKFGRYNYNTGDIEPVSS